MISRHCRGSDVVAKAKCRFVVDENSLMLDRVPAGEQEAEIESMIGELQALQEGGERVDILSGWGSISCFEGEDVANILAHGNLFDRDSSSLLLRLLGRCGAWDEDPATVVDDEVVVDQEPHNSFGIAWARKMVMAGCGMAIIAATHRFRGGTHTVDQLTQPAPVDVVFVATPADHSTFYRTLYSVENVPEGEFFEIAVKAFPDLAFAPTVNFQHFQGAYVHRRPEVVHHLSLINDRFLELYKAEFGSSRNISMRLGIDVSIEGDNRKSEALMRHRDAKFMGRVYRCEWHSKLEPHRNRIYFHSGDEGTDGRVLIGIFHQHLP